MANEEDRQTLYFVKLFLVTSRDQSKSILSLLTTSQCIQLREVAYNILFNEDLEISAMDRFYIEKHRDTLERLASRNVCDDVKKVLALENYTLILRIARITSDYLSQAFIV